MDTKAFKKLLALMDNYHGSSFSDEQMVNIINLVDDSYEFESSYVKDYKAELEVNLTSADSLYERRVRLKFYLKRLFYIQLEMQNHLYWLYDNKVISALKAVYKSLSQRPLQDIDHNKISYRYTEVIHQILNYLTEAIAEMCYDFEIDFFELLDDAKFDKRICYEAIAAYDLLVNDYSNCDNNELPIEQSFCEDSEEKSCDDKTSIDAGKAVNYPPEPQVLKDIWLGSEKEYERLLEFLKHEDHLVKGSNGDSYLTFLKLDTDGKGYSWSAPIHYAGVLLYYLRKQNKILPPTEIYGAAAKVYVRVMFNSFDVKGRNGKSPDDKFFGGLDCKKRDFEEKWGYIFKTNAFMNIFEDSNGK
jgi:hypothetical protein